MILILTTVTLPRPLVVNAVTDFLMNVANGILAERLIISI